MTVLEILAGILGYVLIVLGVGRGLRRLSAKLPRPQDRRWPLSNSERTKW